MIAGIIWAHNTPFQRKYKGSYCKFHGHDKPEFNGLCLNLLYCVKIKIWFYFSDTIFLKQYQLLPVLSLFISNVSI